MLDAAGCRVIAVVGPGCAHQRRPGGGEVVRKSPSGRTGADAPTRPRFAPIDALEEVPGEDVPPGRMMRKGLREHQA